MIPSEVSFIVVICHGSYHTPEPFQPFIAALKAQGVEAYCPQLPSSDLSKMDVGEPSNPDYDRDPPPNGYPQPDDDVKVVSDLLNRLIKTLGKNVLLIGHSAGAFTATMVAIPDLQGKVRKENGASGGIIGIFYECGFLIPPGESVHSFFQPKDGGDPVIPPYAVAHRHGFMGLLSTKEGAKYFFNGLDELAAKHYELGLTASQVPMTILNNDAYIALPCAYLITENDLVLPKAYQEGMVAMQSQRPGVHITTFRCPAGHSPHLTWIEGLVSKVCEFAQELL